MSTLTNIKQTACAKTFTESSHVEKVLRVAIEENGACIQRDIRFYLLRFGRESEKCNLTERVKEIWQETVVEVLKSVSTFDTTKPVRPWLRVIAIRRVHNAWRESKKRIQTVAPAEIAIFKSRAQNDDPSEIEMLDELTSAASVAKFFRNQPNIDEILSVLPNKLEREILRLRYVENVKGAELARRVGATSEGAVQKTAARALNKLRESYKTRS